MPDTMNSVSDFGNVREAVCISTRKIMDACRDQDCSENVPVYLTTESQSTLEQATSVKARYAELLYTDVTVEPIGYQNGYYSMGIQYYYRVIADAVMCGVKPVTIYGLAAVSKQIMLYGGEGMASTFTSTGETPVQQPVGVVEAVDPVLLGACITSPCECGCGCGQTPCTLGQLPEQVTQAFDSALVFTGQQRLLQVTLGQFSIYRLERQTQLLIPSYDYCIPARCPQNGSGGGAENPCEAFSQMQFPVGAFYPDAESTEPGSGNGGGTGCGCCASGSDASAAATATPTTSGTVPCRVEGNGGRRR